MSGPQTETIRFDRPSTSSYKSGRLREWIITNGLGGYASSTIIGANTRGYHGLLVASVKPSLTRILLLSKLEEEVQATGGVYQISVNKYGDVVHPEGYRYLEEFKLDPYPTFTYSLGDVVLLKTIRMVKGKNVTVVTYKALKCKDPILLKIYPLINCRDFHLRTRESSGWNFTQKAEDDSVTVQAYQGAIPLHLRCSRGTYTATGYWYRNFTYDEEAERGLPASEDLYNPGLFTAQIGESEVVTLVASDSKIEDIPKDVEPEERRSERAVKPSSRLLERLRVAADQFIAFRPGDNRETIVAGYHWFGEWGRDAMMSLPGLTLATGRFGDAKAVIFTFLEDLDDGLIPVRFSGRGEPEYDSADTSLLLIYAVQKYFNYSKDVEFVNRVYPMLREIIERYEKGTNFGIHMAEDGLIEIDDGHNPLTWMDARVDGRPAIGRRGKVVEINALWYNALRFMDVIASERGLEEKFSALAQTVKHSFNKTFWNQNGDYLYDFVVDEVPDASIRPNQIFSVSLPYPVLSINRWSAVVNAVKRHLYTPYGLRTLSPADGRYHPRYMGDQRQRDLAYHQGTVWPWLIGPFITAHVRVYGRDGSRFISKVVESFNAHLLEAGVGTISEIFDGDPPHTPRGCIAQAWSVAELLRSLSEDAS